MALVFAQMQSSRKIQPSFLSSSTSNQGTGTNSLSLQPCGGGRQPVKHARSPQLLDRSSANLPPPPLPPDAREASMFNQSVPSFLSTRNTSAKIGNIPSTNASGVFSSPSWPSTP